METDSMKFLTQLNSGCIEICKNMLKSAENVGLNTDDFIIACLDKNAYEQLKDYSGAFLYGDYENNNLTGYQDWSFDATSNFRKIVKSKWKLISEIHKRYKSLCWVDTDIVFIQNPMDFIANNSKTLFQFDIPGSVICSGFMVFNDTPISEAIVSVCGNNTEEDDQILINSLIQSKTEFAQECSLLNQKLFPNGYVYHTLGEKKNAIIVHNNHMVGINTKINKFKEENLWFI
jgi:hypothetical protein